MSRPPTHPSRPSAVIVAESVSWRSPADDPVLNEVTLAVGAGKTGLVGDNGSGKTTLVRILAGELTPTRGSVSRSGSVGLLPQDFAPPAGATVAEALGFGDKLAALARLSEGAGRPSDLEVVADDWDLETRLDAELQRLGLAGVGLDRPWGTLSGGEATRARLAGLFLRRPDLLILDEPTNHLDRPARESLYTAVRGWRGGLLVVSHDRELLGLMDCIVELTPGGVRQYGGGYALYEERRDAEAAAARRRLGDAVKGLRQTRRDAQEAHERQERRSARGHKTRDKVGLPAVLLGGRKQRSEQTGARLAGVFEDRIHVAGRAVAEARYRAAERHELEVALAPVEVPAGKTVLELDGVAFRHPGAAAPALTEFCLSLVGPERVALTGPNGSGKTTVLRLAAGELRPDVGRVRCGVARFAYLDQRAALLDPRRSLLDNYRRWNPDETESACRLTLARFLFRAGAVHRPAGALSGGERLRAALACVLAAPAPPSLLLLDEPTNHLDLASVGHIEQALRQYTGALLVACHDQNFLEAIGIGREVAMTPRF